MNAHYLAGLTGTPDNDTCYWRTEQNLLARPDLGVYKRNEASANLMIVPRDVPVSEPISTLSAQTIPIIDISYFSCLKGSRQHPNCAVLLHVDDKGPTILLCKEHPRKVTHRHFGFAVCPGTADLSPLSRD